jgi:hypothetical protein
LGYDTGGWNPLQAEVPCRSTLNLHVGRPARVAGGAFRVDSLA